MVKMLVVVLVLGLLLVGSVSAIGIIKYSIPQLIPGDYDCENHPGFISDSNPAPFESGQHYINRKSKAIQNQIEEVCD